MTRKTLHGPLGLLKGKKVYNAKMRLKQHCLCLTIDKSQIACRRW